MSTQGPGVRVAKPLTIAVGQPPSVSGDVEANAAVHADVVRAAGARVVAFPELSLTGYELDAPPIAADDPVLTPVVQACEETGSLALVGAPVRGEAGRVQVAMLAVDGSRATVAYRKMYLGGLEPERFSPGTRPAVIDVEGWRLGLAICKDTGVPEHASATAGLGIDAYLAGMLEAADASDVPDARARRVAAAHGVWVAIASFAGSTGGGFEQAAGRSGIWSPEGVAIARADAEPGAMVRATLTGQTKAGRGGSPLDRGSIPPVAEDLARRIAELAAEPRPRSQRAAQAAVIIREHFGARWVGIYAVARGEVRAEAWRGPSAPAHPVFPAEQGLTGEAIRTKHVVVSNDVLRDPRYLANQSDSGSELIVPVLVGGEVVGTLDIESDRFGAFQEADVARSIHAAQALGALWR